MSKIVKPHWPDEVRLKMIEKSEFYSETQIYQYGFYDGYQHAQSQTQELIEQNKELMEMLDKARYELLMYKKNYGLSSKLADEITDLLTKYKKP